MATAFGSTANTLQNTLNSAIGAVISALGCTPGFGDRANIPTTTMNTSSSPACCPQNFGPAPRTTLTECYPP